MKPDEKVLLDNLGKIAYTLDKAYISRLSKDYSVFPFSSQYNKDLIISYDNNIRAIKINRWIFNKEENPGDCFKNVLSLFADGDHSIALVVNRKPSSTEMYFVIKNTGMGRNEDSRNNICLLEEAIKGNFPGTHTAVLDVDETKRLFSFDSCKSVAVLSNTPSEYSEGYISQGLDKLLNGIVPQSDVDSYTVIFLADSLKTDAIRDVVSGFEEIATAMYPFMGYQFQAGESKTETQGEMESIASTESIANSIFRTHSVSGGLNIGIGDVAGIQGGYGYTWGGSKSISNGKTSTEGKSNSISISQTSGTHYSYKSYMIADLIEKTEKTIKRLTHSQSTGLWKFATYVFAGNSRTSKNVANYIKATTQGKDSYIEPSIIQEWAKREKVGTTAYAEIKDYVSHFTHPVFYTSDSHDKDKLGVMMVTPTSYVSTDEISNVIVFPRRSIPGLPVVECAQFGREPYTLVPRDFDVKIGHTYHMHETYDGSNNKPNEVVSLSKEELTKHTFITGSTGSGKSNTVYTILNNVCSDAGYLVIEPTKGEYKTALHKSVKNVYGTNPNATDTKLLSLNPFSFPESIHILEHLDRLIEIFNVCWPMYAAMPAILKDAIERAYSSAGWDLATSRNKYDNHLFPTFKDVLTQIRNVLNESDYSDDNKGDYTGSLVTRIKSLTNGINGLLFVTDDVGEEQLFDEKTIIDLSRVGSTETKSLIMGVLILKLQEYRMHQRETNGILNEGLKHITVIEEAHNLLKRTSTEQATEGANLLGKAVEMISNAIAEMRTYGEGFIIADQAPGLLDMSVIRNTNTKIIMRLPDYTDRELVGKAAGLSEDQIIELARLEKGVAAITQSDWLEPVLCKVDKFDAPSDKKISNFQKQEPSVTAPMADSLLQCIMNNELYRIGERVDLMALRNKVIRSELETNVKCSFIEYIDSGKDEAVSKLRTLVYDFLHAEPAIELSKQCSTIVEWANSVADRLEPSIRSYNKNQIDLALALIVYEQSRRNSAYIDIYRSFTDMYRRNGGVV